MTTAKKIESILRTSMEPAEPATTILTYLRAQDGKKLTKRDLEPLKKIDPSIYINHQFGMCHLVWGKYSQSQGREGGNMLIAYGEGVPNINVRWIEEHNACYFSARVQRNTAREAVLAERVSIMTAGRLVDEIRARQAELNKLLAYEGPLYVEKYAIEALMKEES